MLEMVKNWNYNINYLDFFPRMSSILDYFSILIYIYRFNATYPRINILYTIRMHSSDRQVQEINSQVKVSSCITSPSALSVRLAGWLGGQEPDNPLTQVTVGGSGWGVGEDVGLGGFWRLCVIVKLHLYSVTFIPLHSFPSIPRSYFKSRTPREIFLFFLLENLFHLPVTRKCKDQFCNTQLFRIHR